MEYLSEDFQLPFGHNVLPWMHIRAKKLTCNQFEMTNENGEAPVFKSDSRKLFVNSYLYEIAPDSGLKNTFNDKPQCSSTPTIKL